MKIHLGLAPKLALVFVSFAALLLAGVGAMAYYAGRAALEEAALSELLARAAEKEGALNAWATNRQLELAALARSPYLLDDLAGLTAAPPASVPAQTFHQRLVQALRIELDTTQHLELFILQPETGQIIVSTDPAQEGKFRESQPFFIKGRQGSYLQNDYPSFALQGPAIMAATPLRTAEGRLLGVLTSRLNLAKINEIMLRRSTRHQTFDAFLLNPAHLLVTQPYLLSDPAVLRRGIYTPTANRCLAGDSGSLFAPDYRTIPAIIVYRWLAERQLCLVVKIDQAEVLASLNAFSRTLFLSGILVLAAASILAIGLARSVTRPVRRLQAGVVRFGQGHLDPRLPETSGDELGLLAHEFNHMATTLAEKEAELRRHNEELDQLVQERTLSLRQSEERFSKAFQASPAGLVITRLADGCHIDVNNSYLNLLGYERDEIIGRTTVEVGVIPAEDRTKIVEALRRQGFVHNVEIGVSTRSGEIRQVLASVERIELGDEACLLSIVYDITERKRAQEALLESEDKFKYVFEHSIIGKSITYPSGELHVNQAFCDMLGYSLVELQTQIWQHLTHPDDLELSQSAIAPLLAGEKDAVRFSKRYLHKNGSIVWADVGTFLRRDQEGKPLYFMTTVSDITERKQAEDALHESETRFRALLESAPDAIVSVNRAGRIKLVNNRTESLFGYSREELLEQEIEILLPEHHHPSHRQHRAGYISDPRTRPMGVGYQLMSRRKDGREVPVEVSLSPVETQGDLLVMAIIRDVSEQREAEAKLRHLNEALQHSNAELEQFAYVASHDLQEPLRMVSSYCQLLERRYKGQLDAKADKYIAYAVDGVRRMQNLINDLLAYSRVGTQGKAFEPTDCQAVLTQACANLAKTIQERGAQVEGEALPTVQADQEQLVRLFQNLIGNGLKFQGAAPPQVHVSAERRGPAWCFAVRDNGIGMEPADRERIFEIFQRLHSQTDYPGTGIGLAICKKIVERHGGRIWVESQPGQGATFYFTMADNENDAQRQGPEEVKNLLANQTHNSGEF
jgi:PAS domain S-box-containing protein